ncbi:MAG: Hpt domain-containing protein [Salibacteraceae bacterium]
MKVLYIKGGGNDFEFSSYLNSLFSDITETILVLDAVGKICNQSYDFIFLNSNTLSMELAQSVSALNKLSSNSELFIVGETFPESIIDQPHFIQLPVLENELENLLSNELIGLKNGTTKSFVSFSQIKKIANGDEEFVKDLVDTFLEDFPEYIDGLKESLNKTNLLKIGFYAHKLKAPLNMFGVNELNAEITYLDNLGQEISTDSQINWTEISEKVKQLVNLGERASKEIKALSDEYQVE